MSKYFLLLLILFPKIGFGCRTINDEDVREIEKYTELCTETGQIPKPGIQKIRITLQLQNTL